MPPTDLIGKPAPPLTLLDSNGQPFHVGPGEDSTPIALFFYPKAGTYGCTKEACQFRDLVLGKPCPNWMCTDMIEGKLSFVQGHLN